MAAKIKIEFPNGEQKSYPIGTVPQQILQEIGGRIAKEALIARFNDQFIDLSRPLSVDGKLVFLTFADEDGRDAFWHSSAHILAHAIKALYPEAKFAFGPPVENGFYYDFELTTPLTVGDLEKIEAKMQEIVSADLSFVRQEMTTEKALALFRARNESYKVEQIERLGEPPSIYTDGDFVDLCRGPHLASTGLVRHFKLLSIAGAYWLGDEKNAMLQRVYGISFPKKSQLDDYLIRLEEAKKRDHRKLGRELDLFSINDEIGPGLVLWHPKGAFIRHKIEEFWKEQHLKGGYQFVNTPHVAKLDLWKTSGHVDFFKENMFSPMKVEEMQYQIKPMNCPFHLHIYKSATRSYRDLPIRWAELGTVYRYERSGVMHGLMRVRGFTQDDAHIFCRPDQLDAETERTVKFSMSMLDSFGFSGYDVYVSTRPQNAVGSVENWETATQALKNSLERLSIPYQVDPGEGVFYGPKIDIKIRDAIGRSWQCSTIQVDFNEPERFDLSFIGQDGERHRPIMIHRALLGSLERFFGVLIEHYSGAFPLWLAPVQVCVIPITEKEQSYAAEVFHQLEEAGIRAELDDRNEKVGYKIREASTQKIPIMLVIGPREVQEQTVAIRKRGVGDVGSGSLAEVIKEIELQVAEKKN
ncbi:MAG TPA: threonine--tRNA ligase [bacterium]|nr:threonine--tRNA ligase [bacterium]HNT65502.1 threonine--tRNA ligase [bacterium]HOX87567.1 threonine--tRNA ligase [bacterium]HPG47249.1 threonine--tRNA ligase [bacterium]HPM99545.1 threonine--tRNA ligase [bacterium]